MTTPATDSISAAEALELCRAAAAPGAASMPAGIPALLDVRSEGEFSDGRIGGFENLPILDDEERAKVGTAYKRQGQGEAIRLGHELVAPHREARIAAWAERIRRSGAGTGVIACWRGGLRSGTAAQWVRDAGCAAATVRGGYKAMRRELLGALESPPELWVLSGLTGSGKTRLLHALEGRVPLVDLEGIAVHRGSSFGRSLTRSQPAQATFENEVALRMWSPPRERGARAPRFLVEDESVTIGTVSIPTPVKERMQRAPVVLLRVSLEERVANLYREYVTEPLEQGIGQDRLRQSLRDALLRLQKKLGGARAQELAVKIDLAFAEASRSLHEEWIEALLVHYYDKLYQYSFDRQTGTREIVFQGDFESCRQFLCDSLKP